MLIRIHHTTTFRLAVLASLAFVLVGGAVLGFLYWRMLFVIDGQIDGALAREYADMTAAYTKGGYERLRRTVVDRSSPHYDSLRIYLLIAPDGKQTGNLKIWPAHAPPPGTIADISVQHYSKSARVRTFTFADGSRLLVGRALTELNNFQRLIEESLFSVLLMNLLLGIIAAVFLARYSRHRLGQINATAQEVLQGNLSGRVKVGKGGGEYSLLARNINTMLDRIQRLIGTVRGVTENIAHDLRTPLNRLRGRLEVGLMAPRSPDEYCSILQRAVTEVDTIVDTFNGILKIAKIKADALALPRNPVDLVEVVEELVDLYQVFAEENGVTVEARMITASGASRKIFVQGDGHLISQAVANLLDNAIKYSPQGGTVIISATRSAEAVNLTVSDNGPGIPSEMRTVILDRFVRLETGHDKHGFGLGLSFALAVAEWHGAKLTLTDNAPGLRVTLTFPLKAKED
ncbi:MAG: HAMP domain-containing sensor histidine kinase [Alphaproteobacteria bacterium]